MANAEIDLGLIEEYLDGALDDAAAVKLRGRLKSDPNFAGLMEEAQSDRTLRQAAWSSFEADSITAERFMWRIRGAMVDQQKNTAANQSGTFWKPWRIASISSATAACLLMGFTFGRLGNHSSTPNESPSKSGQVTVDARHSVPIVDQYGQIVAWQTFDSDADAKNFAEDLHRTPGGTGSPDGGQPRLATEEQIQPPQVPF